MIFASTGNTGFDEALEKAKSEEIIGLRFDLLKFTGEQIKTLCLHKTENHCYITARID